MARLRPGTVVCSAGRKRNIRLAPPRTSSSIRGRTTEGPPGRFHSRDAAHVSHGPFAGRDGRCQIHSRYPRTGHRRSRMENPVGAWGSSWAAKPRRVTARERWSRRGRDTCTRSNAEGSPHGIRFKPRDPGRPKGPSRPAARQTAANEVGVERHAIVFFSLPGFGRSSTTGTRESDGRQHPLRRPG